MTIVAQQAINGIVLGSLYVLVALGLTLIYGVLVQINFAHADFVTVGAFAAYFFMHGCRRRLSRRASPSRSWSAARSAGWSTSRSSRRCSAGQRAAAADRDHRRVGAARTRCSPVRPDPLPVRFAVQRRRDPHRRHLLHAAERRDHRGLDRDDRALYAFLKFTFLGKALRAVSQDRETAGLMGINPDRILMLTIVIASALAGMAGAMLGPVLVLTPFAGASVIVKAFAIVIIGGFGNVEGTILAGLLVGLIESFTTQYLGPGLIDIVVFALLLVMLAVRPTGLIAERRRRMSSAAPRRGASPAAVAPRSPISRLLSDRAAAARPADAYWRDPDRLRDERAARDVARPRARLHRPAQPRAVRVLRHRRLRLDHPHQDGSASSGSRSPAASRSPASPGSRSAPFAVRLRGHYLAIASLGFAVITYQILINWEQRHPGRARHLRHPAAAGDACPVARSLRPPVLPGGAASRSLVYLMLDNLVRSPIGETLRAIREDEVSAASLGINAARWKAFAFGVGAAIAGAGRMLLCRASSARWCRRPSSSSSPSPCWRW